MSDSIKIIAIGVVIALIIVVFFVVKAKKAKRKKFINGFQIKFMNLQAGSKAINEEYLRESSEYLMYAAPDVKEEEQIRVDLLNILAKYRESNRLSNDNFYTRAYEAITKK